MASNDEQPTTAVTAAVAPETTDTSATAETTGTTSLVGDIAQTAASAASSVPTTPGIATAGTVTPFELDDRQRRLSLDVSLADLCAKATALYAQKKYEDAADIFSRATEMQAEMNGEMNPKNAEILFLYGRALYKVGQSKSDVLGGAAPVTEGEGAKKANKKKEANGDAKKATDGAEPEKIIEKAIAGAADDAAEVKPADTDKKPLIQIEGDEDSDEEMDDEDAEEGAEEEDDDFETAFQVLELARVLFTKELEEEQQQTDTEQGKGKDVAEGDSPKVRHIKERLADAHDLLAEISLENEKYQAAIRDLRASLQYKQELYQDESEILAECHYKLSLALEFASITQDSEDAEAKAGATAFDQGLRDEAVQEMQAAIDCTKKKLQTQEVEVATMHSPEDNDITRARINDVKAIIADMEQRLVELKKPPVDVKAALDSATQGALNLFGTAAGSNAEIEEAKKNANDLSNLVRKKAKDDSKAEPAAPDAATNGNGKRKAEEPADSEAATESKKAKVEDQPAESVA